MKIKYLGIIIIFVIFIYAFIYYYISPTIKGVDGFGSALYFSIVTITTLGFGEMVPIDCLARTMVCLEVLAGVVIVGIFLNSISEAQTQKLNDQEKKRNKNERYLDAKAKLRQYYLLLNSIMKRYLVEAYAVTTPIDKRKFPKDIMRHQFQFTFNDISDLYKISLLLYDPPYTPVIATFFDVQDKLYSELRSLVSDIDISYWGNLETTIHSFLKTCNDFSFKGSILSCAKTTLNNQDAEMMSKMIREHEGELQMLPSNAINQYISLYSMLIINITLVQQMEELMKRCCNDKQTEREK